MATTKPGPVTLLERLRLDAGLTLDQARWETGCMAKTIRRYERDDVPYPQPSVIAKLADYYGVTRQEILEDLRACSRAREVHDEAA